MSPPFSVPCPTTRRSVLAWTGTGLAAALAGALPGKIQAALPLPEAPATDTGNAGTLRRERFVPLLGSDFHLAAESSSTASGKCRLVDVSPNQLTGPHDSLRFVSFSLLFACAGVGSEGGIHTLRHPALPELELFLSPVGRTDGTCYLEAVCSQRA